MYLLPIAAFTVFGILSVQNYTVLEGKTMYCILLGLHVYSTQVSLAAC